MPSRSRPPLPALVVGLVLALIAGCSGNGANSRKAGDPVSREEATVLAELLHRDFEAGGADVVVSAPYADGAVLTLTGEVDFRRSVGRAQLETTFGNGGDDDIRTVFFTAEDVWFGDVPGLPEALAAAGAPDAGYLRRPLVPADSAGTAPLVDVLLQLVLNLSARSGDDPGAFDDGDYTWQGRRSINGRLSSVYRLQGGETVAVTASDNRLVQYVTPLTDQDFEVTVTLSDHGEREIELPGDDETVEAADYPQVAAQVGV
jgi:hypothetical protein